MATINGNKSANTLTGTSTSDLIYAFDGNDTIRGGGGNDDIYGGMGSDRFVFESTALANGVDTLHDYRYSATKGAEQDVIDLTQMLGSLSSKTNISNFVRLEAGDGVIVLKVSKLGSGKSPFETVAHISNLTGGETVRIQAGSAFFNLEAPPLIVNAAPVLSAAASPIFDGINEDVTDASGTTVASMVVDGSITDTDLFTAIEAIYVTSVVTTNGTWQYKVGGGSWTNFDFSAGNAGKALLLDATDMVRFVPNANWSGTATITFGAWDKAVGTAGVYTTIFSTGNGTAYSTVTDTASITVSAVNDLPTGAVSIAGSAAEDQILTASNTLADVEGLGTVSYKWERASTVDGTYTEISGATNTMYTLGNDDVGNFIRVVASYTDNAGTNESVASSPTAAVANVNDAPTISSGPTFSATQVTITASEPDASDTIALYAGSTSLGALTSGTSTSITVSAAASVVSGALKVKDNATPVAGEADTGWDIYIGGSTSPNDTLTASTRKAVMYGLAGTDSITGSGNADVIYGGAGNDTVIGGDGADTIKGEAGADSLTGGLGADVFIVAKAEGIAASGAFATGGVDMSGNYNDTFNGTETLASGSILTFTNGVDIITGFNSSGDDVLSTGTANAVSNLLATQHSTALTNGTNYVVYGNWSGSTFIVASSFATTTADDALVVVGNGSSTLVNTTGYVLLTNLGAALANGDFVA